MEKCVSLTYTYVLIIFVRTSSIFVFVLKEMQTRDEVLKPGMDPTLITDLKQLPRKVLLRSCDPYLFVSS